MAGLQKLLNTAKEKMDELRDYMGSKKQNYTLREAELDVEMQVWGMREAYLTLERRLPEANPTDEKKIAQHRLGSHMMKAVQDIDSAPFGALYLKVGRLQHDLGMLQRAHNKAVDVDVMSHVALMLREDFPVIQNSRKKLQAAQTELDAAKSRFAQACAKVHKQGYKDSQDKVASFKAELDDQSNATQSIQDDYVEKILQVIARDRELSTPLIALVKEQREYHAAALKLLDASLPSLEDLYNATGKRNVFGTPLQGEGVDSTIAQLAAVINRDGIEVEGIFRLAGSASKIRLLKACLDAGVADFSTREGYSCDIHAVSGAMKLYLREMPEPLLVSSLYNEWLAAVRLTDHNAKLYEIQRLLGLLPRSHYVTLRFLCRFWAHVCAHMDVNKMAPSNIGICIGPNLLWPVNREDSGLSVKDTGSQSSLCETLVMYHEWLFPHDDGELDATLSDPALVPAPRRHVMVAKTTLSMGSSPGQSYSEDYAEEEDEAGHPDEPEHEEESVFDPPSSAPAPAPAPVPVPQRMTAMSASSSTSSLSAERTPPSRPVPKPESTTAASDEQPPVAPARSRAAVQPQRPPGGFPAKTSASSDDGKPGAGGVEDGSAAGTRVPPARVAPTPPAKPGPPALPSKPKPPLVTSSATAPVKPPPPTLPKKP